MTFDVTIEREIIGDEKVLDEFEDVDKYMDPPYNEKVTLKLADGETETIPRGRVIKIE